MYCIYCGAPNPKDATFCSNCGKTITAEPVNASPQGDDAIPSSVRGSSEPPKFILPPSQTVISTVQKPKGEPTVVIRKDKRLASWIVIGLILLILLYPLRNGGSIHEAAREEILQQVPYAVEILAARHPLKVGILRAWTNDQGAMDKAAQEYMLSQKEFQQDAGIFVSYLAYYMVIILKDQVRNAQADWLERQFGLGESQASPAPESTPAPETAAAPEAPPGTPPAPTAPEVETAPAPEATLPPPPPQPAKPSAPSNPIVGTWKTSKWGIDTVMELDADGHYRFRTGPVTETGVYTYSSSDGTLRMQDDGFFSHKITVWNCQIAGDSMSIIQPDGPGQIYSRVGD